MPGQIVGAASEEGRDGPPNGPPTSLCLPVFSCTWEGRLDPGLDSGDQLGSSLFLGAPEHLRVELFPLGHLLLPFRSRKTRYDFSRCLWS